ncbi:MAG: DUF429 domain-containing protein [Anaerolineae bacterium]
MFLTDSIYVGMDPTSARKEVSYAALDRDLRLLALAEGSLEEVLVFLSEHQNVVVAVNAPRSPNQGVARQMVEKQNAAEKHPLRGVELRLAEYELRQRGIAVSGTPARRELCPAWMQIGFSLYDSLSQAGFLPFFASQSPRRWLETHPHACFCVLLEQIPLPRLSLEGRIQRQLILYEQNLHIPDPMDFFEEITRFKLLKGKLPVEIIYSAETLDVLVAAYTAWLAAHHPEKVSRLGDPTEGEIILPGTLKEKYSP